MKPTLGTTDGRALAVWRVMLVVLAAGCGERPDVHDFIAFRQLETRCKEVGWTISEMGPPGANRCSTLDLLNCIEKRWPPAADGTCYAP